MFKVSNTVSNILNNKSLSFILIHLKIFNLQVVKEKARSLQRYNVEDKDL